PYVARMLRLVCAAFVLLRAGCGAKDDSPRAVMQAGGDDVVVHVEVADTESERARGLMGRTELADDSGMVFVFPQDTTSSFWMKDTLIPLSIAFYDDGGRIVRILDMEPCRGDPCPVYDPRAVYRGALEVDK